MFDSHALVSMRGHDNTLAWGDTISAFPSAPDRSTTDPNKIKAILDTLEQIVKRNAEVKKILRSIDNAYLVSDLNKANAQFRKLKGIFISNEINETLNSTRNLNQIETEKIKPLLERVRKAASKQFEDILNSLDVNLIVDQAAVVDQAAIPALIVYKPRTLPVDGPCNSR